MRTASLLGPNSMDEGGDGVDERHMGNTACWLRPQRSKAALSLGVLLWKTLQRLLLSS